jgi:hypothetical protein
MTIRTSVVVRDTVLARVVDFRGLSLFGGLHTRSLPPMDAFEVIGGIRSKLRKRKGDVAVERLRDPLIGRFMIDWWNDVVDELDARASIPPVLQTTDGDPLLFVTESFQFDAEAGPEIEKRLAAMDGVDDVRIKDGESEIVFVRPGNPMHRGWENTVVGRVFLSRDSLRIETSSEPRADALRVRVRDACSGLLRGGTRKTKDPTVTHTARRDAAQREATQGGARKPPAGPSPREQALLLEVKEAHYREWIDTPVPALGGRTPRAAARSATSRQRLDLLLREMENQENHLPEESRFDIGLLRHELGLDP